MEKTALEKELAKCKKAVTVRNELIMELRESIAGHYEIQKILSAYIGIIVGKSEFRINREELKKAIGKYDVSVTVSSDGEDYIIKAVPVEEGKEE